MSYRREKEVKRSAEEVVGGRLSSTPPPGADFDFEAELFHLAQFQKSMKKVFGEVVKLCNECRVTSKVRKGRETRSGKAEEREPERSHSNHLSSSVLSELILDDTLLSFSTEVLVIDFLRSGDSSVVVKEGFVSLAAVEKESRQFESRRVKMSLHPKKG